MDSTLNYKIAHTANPIMDGNGAGSGRVAPIPTPPPLFKIILIPIPFKKLNGAGRYYKFPYLPRPASFNFSF